MRPNIDVERASKFDQFWEPSWNATFSAQEAPRGASAADRRRKGSPPGATGEGFRMGDKSLSSRTGCYQELGFGRTWQSEEDLVIPIPHAVPVGRRIEAPLGGSTAAQSFWSKEGCDKERSLEEQSFEILVFL